MRKAAQWSQANLSVYQHKHAELMAQVGCPCLESKAGIAGRSCCDPSAQARRADGAGGTLCLEWRFRVANCMVAAMAHSGTTANHPPRLEHPHAATALLQASAKQAEAQAFRSSALRTALEAPVAAAAAGVEQLSLI